MWALALLLAPAAARAEHLLLAQGSGEQARLIELDARGAQRRRALDSTLRAPLGSLWKLFVHAYLVDRDVVERDYQCRGGDREEVYCCDRGERIGRDLALVRSCGLYYQPARLELDAADWRRYWADRQAPAWLQQLDRLQPQAVVPVRELLAELAALPAQAAIRAVLLDVLLQGERPPAAELGSRLRVKTWSWHREEDDRARIGGFAGWLADGTPVWAQAAGTSQAVLQRYAPALETALPLRPTAAADDCVEVRLFARYPIAAVRRAGETVEAGVLQGSYEVEFDRGNRFAIESRGELVLSGAPGRWQLTARLSREDYVARVLQREAAVQPVQAARALAIAIRSYLQQNAESGERCLRIDDSSAQQRVLAQPASAEARAVAAWTADLVLAGAAVRYHLDQAAENRLAWTAAVAQAESGLRFDAILREAYPRADLARWGRPESECLALPEAERWLRDAARRWQPQLLAEAGYEPPDAAQVCRLRGGRPFVDRARQRIHVRGLISQQDRLDLTHEYLHLAFAAHPRGQDENYIEALTRRLLLE